MAPFQPEDKVLVNGKHAELKIFRDIGGEHFEIGVNYTEDKRFDIVIYPFTDIKKIDPPIESAKKLKFVPSWKYDLATDALICNVPGDFKIFRNAQALAPACEYPRVSASSALSVFYRRLSAFIMLKPCGFSTPRTLMPADISGHALQRRDSGRHHLRLIFVSLSDRTRKIKFELFPIINENGRIKSPQRTQSSAIPVTMYEKAAPSRLRTRMTRIARIFTDMRAYVFDYFPSDQQIHSYLHLLENKPQINAVERRLIDSASEFISRYLEKFNYRSNYS